MKSVAHNLGFTALALSLLAGAMARAGQEISPSKEIQKPAPANDWTFQLGVPGWLANTSSTIGINGVSTHSYLSAGELLRHTDMLASLSAEAKKGPFGVYGDMLYVSAADHIQSDGLIGKMDVRLDQWIVDLELYYRVLEGPKGYLDLRAGVRYTNIFSKLQIAPNDAAIDHASTAFVNDLSQRVADRISALDIVGLLRNELDTRVQKDLTTRLAAINGRQRLTLPIAPLDARSPDRLRDVIDRIINRRVDDLAVALRAAAAADEEAVRAEAVAKTQADKAAIAAKANAVRAAAQQRVSAVKQQISNEVASALKSGLTHTAALAESWWDPYVGFRFRYNLSKAFYLTGKADVGGFGVGSEITWQASGAIGCQLTRYIYTEAGYRYLYTDYKQDGFLYDTTQSGFQLTTGINF